MNQFLLAEGVTFGQVVLALVVALISVGSVCVTHWLARSREIRQDKLKRLEQLYMSSRELIYDFHHVATVFRSAAEGHRAASSAVSEIKDTVNKVYSFGSGERPYYTVQMLIEVYFPDMRPWLKKVDDAERAVRETMKRQNANRPGVAYRDATSVSVIDAAERTYSASALEMTALIRAEAAKVDDWQWFTRPRLAPPAAPAGEAT